MHQYKIAGNDGPSSKCTLPTPIDLKYCMDMLFDILNSMSAENRMRLKKLYVAIWSFCVALIGIGGRSAE